MELPSFAEVVQNKKLTEEQRQKDIAKLVEWSGTDNGVKLIGNPYIQSYMMEHMGRTSFDGKPTMEQTFNDPVLCQKLYKGTVDKTPDKLVVNMPQAYTRISPVCFLKPSVAKYLYTKLKATKVLDITAGWGGRMVGAMACGIEYTGIDTNLSLQKPYEEMISELNVWTSGKARMIWDDCRNVDLSTIEYDLAFTSPPYYNKEVYEHMRPFATKASYYNEFLIPMLTKCLTHIQNNGWVCLNVNEEYYTELVSYGFRKCDRIEEFQQSTRKCKDGSIKMEKVYCWQPEPKPEPETCASCSRCRELEAEVKKLKEAMKLLLS